MQSAFAEDGQIKLAVHVQMFWTQHNPRFDRLRRNEMDENGLPL